MKRKEGHLTALFITMCIWGGFQWMVLGIIKTKVVISVYEASCTRDSSSTLNTLLHFLYVTLALVVLSVNIKARSIVLRILINDFLILWTFLLLWKLQIDICSNYINLTDHNCNRLVLYSQWYVLHFIFEKMNVLSIS